MRFMGAFLFSFIFPFIVIAAKAPLATFDIDVVHSFVLFKVSHLGFSNSYGRFTQVSGRIELDEKNIENSKVNIEIPVASLDTQNAKRDKHLRGPDFFNAKQFPTITFRSQSLSKVGKKYKLIGTLNMHGVSKEITGNLELMRTGEDPWGATRTGGEVRFMIDRRDFKMNYMTGENAIGEKVEIIASIEGIKKGIKKGSKKDTKK